MAMIENPEAWPRYVYCEPGDGFNATFKRGGPYFDVMAESGFRVTRIPADGISRSFSTGPPGHLSIFQSSRPQWPQ